MATAGYTPQGGTAVQITGATQENPAGLLIILPEQGTINSASFYGRYTVNPKATTVQIYAGTAGAKGALLHTSATADLSSTSFALETRNFSSPVLNAGTYWLQLNMTAEGPGSGLGEGARDTGGATNTGYQLNDVGGVVYDTNQYSIYVTYTPTATDGFNIALV